MGRPKRQSGGHIIQRSEELFRQSVHAGKPDYSYLALAIGASPGSPPPWAILECIEFRSALQVKAARGDANVSGILDDMVRLLDSLQHNWWLQTGGDVAEISRPQYDPPSLRSVILHVVKQHPTWSGFIGSADDDWMKPVREAWDWEQEHDLLPDYGGELLMGFETTSRIDRVIMQSVAAERGDPDDMAKAAWLFKTLMDQKQSDQL